ncbi:MAG: hypothetical protein FWE30_01095 [Bacteroidales bacterium]|nr:hypothetical protein [Bacteroidales bacterium]
MRISRIKPWISIVFLFLGAASLRAQQYYISDIQVEGNKRTQAHIILRELDAQKGDSVRVSRIRHVLNVSRENLENTSLFNYVYMYYTPLEEGVNNIVLNVKVEERWYTFPMLNIRYEDRNLSAWLKSLDFNRVSFEFGAQVYNLWGLNHGLTAGLQLGYRQALGLTYKNITLDRRQKHFLSAGVSMQRSHHIDLMTVEDAPFNVKMPDQLLEQSFNLFAHYTFRYDVRTTHNFALSSGYQKIADTVLTLNPDYWGLNRNERIYLNFKYFFKKDNRDYIAYPLKGYFLKTEGRLYVSHDLGVRYAQLNANAQYYWKLGHRWYASEKFTAGASIKNTRAYILDQALGYEESALRGYEYYVIDGQHYANLNSSIRYNLMPKTIYVLHWLSALPKFNKIHFALYATAFFDMGAVYHRYPGPNNYLSNRFLYSGGIGLDLVTYYDIVFVLNYSMNRQGERGLYFSLKLPFM